MRTDLEVSTRMARNLPYMKKVNFNLETCVMAQILGNIILINNYITTYPVKSISTCSHVFLSKENNAFFIQNHVIYLKLHHLELIIYYCFSGNQFT